MKKMNMKKILVVLVIAALIMGGIGSVSAVLGVDNHRFRSMYEVPGFEFDSFRPAYGAHGFNIEKPSNLPISRSCSSGYLEASYTSTFNGKTITGARIDNIPPFRIAEDIPFNGATFHFRVFANRWP